jgi:hypothetical protein
MAGNPVAEPLDPKEAVSIEELTITNMYEIEALIKVPTEKGIVNGEASLNMCYIGVY